MEKQTPLDNLRPMMIAPEKRVKIRHALAEWYEQHRRDLPWRRTRDPYAIWISEVMLQQTQVNTTIPYFGRFLELFPDVRRLAQADEQSVLKAWEGLGYYSRARNLHRAARIIAANGGQVPSDRRTILQLPGVGDYIAAAVLSIAFGRPYAVVDGNVKRVLARLLCLDTQVNQASGHTAFQEAADQLLDTRHPGRHNQAVMELGALVCSPHKPLCPTCPLTACCEALQNRIVDQYPRRADRPKIGEQLWAAGVIVKNGRLLITQRPAVGLLAGMWEFPSFRPAPGQDPGQACLSYIRSALGLTVDLQQQIATVRHAYTHFKLRMDVFLCDWQSGRIRLNGPAAFSWVRPDLIGRFPLHRAVHKVLPALAG